MQTIMRVIKPIILMNVYSSSKFVTQNSNIYLLNSMKPFHSFSRPTYRDKLLKVRKNWAIVTNSGFLEKF